MVSPQKGGLGDETGATVEIKMEGRRKASALRDSAALARQSRGRFKDGIGEVYSAAAGGRGGSVCVPRTLRVGRVECADLHQECVQNEGVPDAKMGHE